MNNLKINYKTFGRENVSIIIEMALGACMGEWIQIAKELSVNNGVLLYERAGINNSAVSLADRTPINIAQELYELLQQIKHEEKIMIIAHSQGGLYAQQFTRLYPEMVKGIILLDPLSANDSKFKELLSNKEYKKSGVDKTANISIMYRLAKLHMGFLTKKIMKGAPPFCYYNSFDEEARKDILNAVTKPEYCITALNEYVEAHKNENIRQLKEKGDFPDIPLFLITHTSQLAVEENMKYGNNSKDFATKIENIWQDIMKEYLNFSKKSTWIQAKNSSHYIHLTEKELLFEGIQWINSQV
ncbi:MAG: alpha/beta hydrolase [Mobilitalea sp.]